MKIVFLLYGILLSQASFGKSLPKAIECYQEAANSEKIDSYMSCFSKNPVMIDVSRTISGQEKIRDWAKREVMPQGKSFKHRKILDQKEGYAKTEVNWMSWIVHYHYWWDKNGKITKMSLQYRD